MTAQGNTEGPSIPAETQPPPRSNWRSSPVDERVRDWRTINFERTVLVIVRTVTTLTRCLDIVSLLETDRRIQIVFTYDEHNPAIFHTGVTEFLARMQAPVIGWEQACATWFDLAIAASENDELHRLDAPILLVPHGIGYQKYYPRSGVVAGMDPTRLVRDGRVVPTVIGLSHPEQRAQLAASCPEAVRHSEVIGDPCLDRLLASRHRAELYREELGSAGRKLIVLATTWGPQSLLGRHPDLPERLVAELESDEYAVAAILHPGTWSAHGPWQIRSWLAGARRCGLVLTPPDEWQPVLAGAHCVVSDSGSLALYAAAVHIPVLLATNGTNTVAGSPLAELTAAAPDLDHRYPLRAQLEEGMATHLPRRYEHILRRTVANPGESAKPLRHLVYRLLRLSEPDSAASFAPIAPNTSKPQPVASYVVGAQPDEHGVALTRYPALTGSALHEGLDYRHLTADVERASLVQLGSAKIMYVPRRTGSATRRAQALRRWPHAEIAATALDESSCALCTRDGRKATLTMTEPGIDPLLLASLAYARLSRDGTLPTMDYLVVGERRIAVMTDVAAVP